MCSRLHSCESCEKIQAAGIHLWLVFFVLSYADAVDNFESRCTIAGQAIGKIMAAHAL